MSSTAKTAKRRTAGAAQPAAAKAAAPQAAAAPVSKRQKRTENTESAVSDAKPAAAAKPKAVPVRSAKAIAPAPVPAVPAAVNGSGSSAATKQTKSKSSSAAAVVVPEAKAAKAGKPTKQQQPSNGKGKGKAGAVATRKQAVAVQEPANGAADSESDFSGLEDEVDEQEPSLGDSAVGASAAADMEDDEDEVQSDGEDLQADGDAPESDGQLQWFEQSDEGEGDDDDDQEDKEEEPLSMAALNSLDVVKRTSDLIKQAEKESKRPAAAVKQETGVVYLGHIPYGFFEAQMRGFFSQFGKVLRLRLSRNPKTGKSRHYGFIEFESPQVASIVAETMNNYMMFGRTLVCSVVPKDKVHADQFKQRKYRDMRPRNRRRQREVHNQERTPEQQTKRVARLVARDKKRKASLLAMGIDASNLPSYEPAAKKPRKAAAVPGKNEVKATAATDAAPKAKPAKAAKAAKAKATARA